MDDIIQFIKDLLIKVMHMKVVAMFTLEHVNLGEREIKSSIHR